MRIGILGSGAVGQTLGAKLVEEGHDVALGTRRPDALDELRGLSTLRGWLMLVDGEARVVSFAEAAAHGEVILNAAPGFATLEVLAKAGAENLDGKILVDITNPLDFSRGFPPSLTVCNTDSLAERIQRTYPAARVVKALNTVTASLMVAPDSVAGGDHTLFVCGDDADAKAQVTEWMREWFGWRDVVDLGALDTARGTEAYLLLWTRTMSALGTPLFNVKIAR